jgi:ADP-ribose pyrophosphatase YjhB (NUDIX family)
LYGAKGWTPPKANQHENESELDAAKRGVHDETGLRETTGYTLRQEAAIFSTEYWDAHPRCNKTSSYFIAENVKDAAITCGQFVGGCEWLSARHARERMGWVEMRQLVDAAELFIHKDVAQQLPARVDTKNNTYYGHVAARDENEAVKEVRPRRAKRKSKPTRCDRLVPTTSWQTRIALAQHELEAAHRKRRRR